MKNKMNKKLELIYTVGLPASGKSTWAKKYVEENSNFLRVNRDDFREMLNGYKFSDKTEKLVTKIHTQLIKDCLSAGFSVVCDDTNFNPKTVKIFNEISEEFDCTLTVKDFTWVDLQTCIDRDSKRNRPVTEKIIRNFYNTYLNKDKNA